MKVIIFHELFYDENSDLEKVNTYSRLQPI